MILEKEIIKNAVTFASENFDNHQIAKKFETEYTKVVMRQQSEQ